MNESSTVKLQEFENSYLVTDVIHVEKITSSNDFAHIECVLKQQEGVKSVSVKPESDIITVTYDSSQTHISKLYESISQSPSHHHDSFDS
jgi:copper chaperone CopZ